MVGIKIWPNKYFNILRCNFLALPYLKRKVDNFKIRSIFLFLFSCLKYGVVDFQFVMFFSYCCCGLLFYYLIEKLKRNKT